VRVGRAPNRAEARKLQQKLTADGFDTFIAASR